MVAVGPGGVPNDVQVIPASRHARDLGCSESDVQAEWTTRGYWLTTVESFYEFLKDLKAKVLAGLLNLPTRYGTVTLKNPFHTPRPPSPAAAQRILSTVLSEIYRAFNLPDEGEAFDALAKRAGLKVVIKPADQIL